MAKQEKKRIHKECLIFCEGRDEYNFLVSWMNSSALAHEEGFSKDIQVIDFEGNENLYNALASYKVMDNFCSVRYLMIIRDAERNAQGAVQSIQNSLHRNGFLYPQTPAQWIYDTDNDINIGFLLFPSCSLQLENGTLEDLCLQILAKPDAPQYMSRIDSFLDDLEAHHGKFTHKHKTQLHTYFSVSNKFTGLKTGEAANAGAFNWAHQKLAPMRDFLRQMFTTHTER